MSDPVRYSYQNVKDRAKQRKTAKFPNGIPFTITLEEFRQWCVKTKYMKSKGRTAECYDIDRKDENEGYHIWNIRKLRKDKNIQKYHKTKKLEYDYMTQEAKVVVLSTPDYDDKPSVNENDEEYF